MNICEVQFPLLQNRKYYSGTGSLEVNSNFKTLFVSKNPYMVLKPNEKWRSVSTFWRQFCFNTCTGNALRK